MKSPPCLLLTAILALVLPLAAQPVLDWATLSSGSQTSAGGAYELSATLGPVATSLSRRGPYAFRHGFWSVAATDSASDELLQNGGFENLAGTFLRDGYGLMSLQPGSTLIPGWTVIGAELVWGSNENTFGARTPFGDCFLELTGYHDAHPYAGVEQTIATVPGRRYRLSLSLGSNTDYPGAGGRKQVSVSCGEASTVFTFDPSGTPANEWKPFDMTFEAAATATRVAINGLTATGVYLAVDQASVRSAAAELKILAVRRSGNELRLRFLAAAGHSYVLESASHWALEAWRPVSGTETVGAGELVEIVLSDPFVEPRRFYRMRERGRY